MKFKVGDKVRVLTSDPRVANTVVTITGAEKIMNIQYYVAQDINGKKWGFTEDELEFASVYDFFNSLANERRKLVQTIIPKEDKPMKFTFSTKEGYHIDKSNNTKIQTITTTVTTTVGGDKASATCDKVDYDERQGVLEALANLACRGDFDKEYHKAVKANAFADKKKRTCTYCGKTFDTVEEKLDCEAWHVERRKARRERYKLRKRAKEIAFEEAAQKLAKEMTGEK